MITDLSPVNGTPRNESAGEDRELSLRPVEVCLTGRFLPEQEQSLAVCVEKLGQQLGEHPSLANWRLDPVNTIQARNSELLEYRIGNEPTAPTILVKHIRRSRSPAVAKETVTREFAALESVRRRFNGPFLDTMPTPIALLAEGQAMVRTKLPGLSLKWILQRDANAVCGPLRRRGIGKMACAVGGWLQFFHEGTRKPPLLHNHQVLTDELTKQLQQCKSNGFDGDLLEHAMKSASLVSKRLEGQRVPAAARHGDFIPENILLDRNNVGVVDFQNFGECDVIYKDVSSFVTYVTIMSARPYYGRSALQTVLKNFLMAYDGALRHDLLTLYNLISMATLAARTRRRRPRIAGYLGGFNLLEKQLAEYSRELLQL